MIALTKSTEGRTCVSGEARGDESHASLLGGLFRDAALLDILDRSLRLPDDADGVMVVEGLTDEAFLRLAAARLKRPDLLAGVYITTAGGAEQAVVQAGIMKHQTPKPVLVLLDSDEPDRHARDNLVKRLGFSAKRDILMCREVTGGQGSEDVESEDLFPPALIEGFVQEKGEAAVVKRKEARPEGGWRYDLNATGKEAIVEYVERCAGPADLDLWLKLLGMARSRLGLS